MIFGDLVGLKLPDICFTGEENREKTSPRKLVPTEDRTRTRCVTGARYQYSLKYYSDLVQLSTNVFLISGCL